MSLAAGSIAGRLAAVHDGLAEETAAAGREPGSVRLVLVSKNAGVAEILEAYEAGHRDFGENYVKAAGEKMRALEERGAGGIRWHMVGQLQSNKAAWAARNFDLLHSLATASAAAAVNKAMAAEGRHGQALVQVRLGGGSVRGGVEPESALSFAREVAALGNIRLCGVMGVAPAGQDARPHFCRLRGVLEEMRGLGLPNAPLGEMSAGMSGDFRDAIREGATVVRLGQAVFGKQP